MSIQASVEEILEDIKKYLVDISTYKVEKI